MAIHWHINQRFNEDRPVALATLDSRATGEVELGMLRNALMALGWDARTDESNPTYSDVELTWGTDHVTFCLWGCQAPCEIP